jgi:GIY-YIG catalytic domain
LPPAKPGVYAWFFKSIPPVVPTGDCVRRDSQVLLYAGIAPKSPQSRETLRSRIRYHYRGNAEGSTLRLTLGCLLKDEIGTVLRRVGSGNRMTFGPNEKRLTEWLAKKAVVGWLEIAEPWVLEGHIIATTSLPLNIESNNKHAFCEQIRRIRVEARQHARAMPVLTRDDT